MARRPGCESGGGGAAPARGAGESGLWAVVPIRQAKTRAFPRDGTLTVRLCYHSSAVNVRKHVRWLRDLARCEPVQAGMVTLVRLGASRGGCVRGSLTGALRFGPVAQTVRALC
jgi:hypothetical protein